jgi:hypothetical protein
MDSKELKEYRQRLIDAFEVPELFDYMEITMDEFLDAFPDKWEDNYDLWDAVGYSDYDEDYEDYEGFDDEEDFYNPEQELDDDYG